MRIVDELEENGLLATEIHKLGVRIWRKAQREQLRVIIFTSGCRGEGKSTTVAYLATATNRKTGCSIRRDPRAGPKILLPGRFGEFRSHRAADI
jgi:pantothenate kinase